MENDIVNNEDASKDVNQKATNMNSNANKGSFKFNNKLFLLLSIIICSLLGIVAGTITSLTSIKSAYIDSSKYNSCISSYDKTDYDYIVYSPVAKQVEDMKKGTYVNKIMEFYSYKSTLELSTKSVESNALFSSNLENLNISSFNEKRLVSGSTNIKEGEIFLDYVVANKLGAEIGSEVKLSFRGVSDLKFTVCGIFETNKFYEKGSVFFPYVGQTKKTIDSLREVELTTLLIDAKNNDLCLDWLRNTYIPLGEMLPRDAFTTDAEYEAYKEDFLSRDYSSSIYNKHDVLAREKEMNVYLLDDAEKKLSSAALIIGLSMLFTIALPIIAIFYERRTQARTKFTNSSKSYYIGINVATVVAYILSFVTIIVASAIFENAFLVFTPLLGIVAGTIAIGVGVSFVIVSLINNLVCILITNKKF